MKDCDCITLRASVTMPASSVLPFDKAHTIDPQIIIRAQELLEAEAEHISTLEYSVARGFMDVCRHMQQHNIRDAKAFEGVAEVDAIVLFRPTRMNYHYVLFRMHRVLHDLYLERCRAISHAGRRQMLVCWQPCREF